MRRMFALLLTAVMLFVLVPAGSAAAADGIQVMLDGEQLQFDAQPFTENDRTLVPVRALAEKLGFQVGWNEQEQKITLTKDRTVIELWIGQTRVTVNGKESTIDVAPKKVGGRTFVPVRFISETLGTDVRWDAQSQTVNVTSGKALLDKISKAQTQSADHKLTADFTVNAAMSDPAKPGNKISFEIPMHMDAVSYHKDQLVTMTMEMPSLLGLPGDKLTIRTAVKDGQVWTQDPITEEWTKQDASDPAKGLGQLGLSETDLADLMKLQDQFLAKAVVKVGAIEDVDGVKARRVDVDLGQVDFASILKDLGAGLDELAGSGTQMDLKTGKFLVTFWVGPETQFVYRTSLELNLSLSIVDAGQNAAIDIAVKGDMHATPNAEPVKFPDFASPAAKLTPDELHALVTYAQWSDKDGNTIDCIVAAGHIDGYLGTKDYAAGKAAADKAAACFAGKQKAYAAVTPPPQFAQAHQTIMTALGDNAKAYTTWSEVYALAAAGDLTGSDAKRADAVKQTNQASDSLLAGMKQANSVETKYGIGK